MQQTLCIIYSVTKGTVTGSLDKVISEFKGLTDINMEDGRRSQIYSAIVMSDLFPPTLWKSKNSTISLRKKVFWFGLISVLRPFNTF